MGAIMHSPEITFEESDFNTFLTDVGPEVDRLATYLGGIRDGVFKVAAARGLDSEEAAELLRVTLRKVAEEDSNIRDSLVKVSSAMPRYVFNQLAECPDDQL